MPEISEDGKTVTVKIKKGVMFSEPVSREVTSADVRYGIERAFTAAVGNGYARDLLRRHRGRAGGARRLQGAGGHHDAGRPDDRVQAHQRNRRGARRRAGDADLGPGPEGVRGEVRREDPVDVRRGVRGLHRPVHGRVRRAGQGDRLRARQAHPSRAQPGVHPGRRLPPGVPGRDRHRGRQRRCGGREPARHHGREPRPRRARAALEPAQDAAREQQARAVGGPGRWLAHDLDGQRAARRSTTSTSARP